MNSKNNNRKPYVHTSKALKDAFYAAGGEGRDLAIQAKKFAESRTIATRIRALKTLCFDTFMGDLIPGNHNWRPDVYFGSKEKMRTLGIKGGAEYDKVLTALKYTWNSPQTYKEAIEALGR
jgi:hypothetical protein